MLRLPMENKDNKGFFIRPERELINRLHHLSKEFKTQTANKIAVEVINEYLDLWAEAERAKRKVIATQKESRRPKGDALRRPIHEASALPSSKPQTHGKKGRR